MDEQKCEVCRGESPTSLYVGVAAVPGVAFSCSWCQNCLREGAVPQWVADFNLDSYPIQDLADWFKEQMVWFEGKYRTMVEYAGIRPPRQKCHDNDTDACMGCGHNMTDELATPSTGVFEE